MTASPNRDSYNDARLKRDLTSRRMLSKCERPDALLSPRRMTRFSLGTVAPVVKTSGAPSPKELASKVDASTDLDARVKEVSAMTAAVFA